MNPSQLESAPPSKPRTAVRIDAPSASLRTRLYRASAWAAVALLLAATAAGVVDAFRADKRPPGLGMNYVDDINTLLESDYWTALDEMHVAVAVDGVSRIKMLEEMGRVAKQHDDLGTQVFALRELSNSVDYIKSPEFYTDLASAQLAQQRQNAKFGTADATVVEQAQADCRRALELDDDFAAAHYVLGQLYKLSANTQQADEAFRNATRLVAGKGSAGGGGSLTRLAQSSSADGDKVMHVLALRKLAQAQVAPNPVLYNDLASALLENQRERVNADEINESVLWSQRAIQANPNFAPAYCNLGGALALSGQNTQAAECFRKACALDPTLVSARQGLAYVEQQLAKEGKASP